MLPVKNDLGNCFLKVMSPQDTLLLSVPIGTELAPHSSIFLTHHYLDVLWSMREKDNLGLLKDKLPRNLSKIELFLNAGMFLDDWSKE